MELTVIEKSLAQEDTAEKLTDAPDHVIIQSSPQLNDHPVRTIHRTLRLSSNSHLLDHITSLASDAALSRGR